MTSRWASQTTKAASTSCSLLKSGTMKVILLRPPRVLLRMHHPRFPCRLLCARALSDQSNQNQAHGAAAAPPFPGKGQTLPKYKALLVDAGGTLLQPAVPVEETYAAYGVKYGVRLSPREIKDGFKQIFSVPWKERLRYEGDGKPFWRYAVAQATGCEDEKLFEELYLHYSKAAAWALPLGAMNSLNRLKQHGMMLGVISNFDTRLRPLLQELNIASLFDCIIVSCEVGYEKPAPQIFEAALRELDVDAAETILLGDDPITDKEGAKAVGIDAWLWKKEVHSFEEVATRCLHC